MGVIIPFHTKEHRKQYQAAQQLSLPEYLFNLYREARIQQGWEEFKWTSLSETQKYVWHLVAIKLQERSTQV